MKTKVTERMINDLKWMLSYLEDQPVGRLFNDEAAGHRVVFNLLDDDDDNRDSISYYLRENNLPPVDWSKSLTDVITSLDPELKERLEECGDDYDRRDRIFCDAREDANMIERILINDVRYYISRLDVGTETEELYTVSYQDEVVYQSASASGLSEAIDRLEEENYITAFDSIDTGLEEVGQYSTVEEAIEAADKIVSMPTTDQTNVHHRLVATFVVISRDAYYYDGDEVTDIEELNRTIIFMTYKGERKEIRR